MEFWIDRRIRRLHFELYCHPKKGTDDPDYLSKVDAWKELRCPRKTLEEKKLFLDSILIHQIDTDSGNPTI